jgi:hypothetical protein
LPSLFKGEGEMLEKIKAALRSKTTDVGIIEEINDLINEAKADLILSGLSETKVIDSDALIIRAVKFYAKAHFGLDNPDSDKYQARYDSLKEHLCLSTDYTEV